MASSARSALVFAVIAGAALFGVTSAARARPPAPDFHGHLFRYVLGGGGPLERGDLAQRARSLPAPVRRRLEQFRTRASRVRSRLVPPAGGPDPDGKDGFYGRQATERALVGLFETPDVARDAAAFARRLPVMYEYEGFPDGALQEAAYAEKYLRAQPETPFAPYLQLYLALRYRIAFETQAEHGGVKAQRASAKKYRVWLAAARRAPDPLIRAAADDLDRQPAVYTTPPPLAPHPRTFD